MINDINTSNSGIEGIVEITIDHPEITDSYNQSFTISENSVQTWTEDFEGNPSNRWDQWNIGTTSRSYEGSQAAYFGGIGNCNALASRKLVEGGSKIGYISFWYWERSNGTGHGIRLKNSNGNYEVGAMTDNPQFSFDDSTGPHQINEGDPSYTNWTKCELTFDWDRQQATVQFSDNSTGSETGDLKQGLDIETVELWTYSSENWCRDTYDQTNHWDLLDWGY